MKWLRRYRKVFGFTVLLAGTISLIGSKTAFTDPAPPVPQPPSSGAASAAIGSDPGTEIRQLSLRHVWTRESLSVIYKIGGVYQPEALQKIDWFLRDYRCSKSIEMDPKLIDLLWDLSQELHLTQPIRVVSGYRSEGYNASLLRAGRTVDPHSQHMYGRAVDVVFPGIPLDQVRQAAAKYHLGGVGYYPFSGPAFIHLDTGPVRQWEEMHPAQRRQMHLPVRPHRRLRLDCNLKMADVLKELPVAEVEGALPFGAASDLPPMIPKPLGIKLSQPADEKGFVDLPGTTTLSRSAAAISVLDFSGAPRIDRLNNARPCGDTIGPKSREAGKEPAARVDLSGTAIALALALHVSEPSLCAKAGDCLAVLSKAGKRQQSLIFASTSVRLAETAKACPGKREEQANAATHARTRRFLRGNRQRPKWKAVRHAGSLKTLRQRKFRSQRRAH